MKMKECIDKLEIKTETVGQWTQPNAFKSNDCGLISEIMGGLTRLRYSTKFYLTPDVYIPNKNNEAILNNILITALNVAGCLKEIKVTDQEDEELQKIFIIFKDDLYKILYDLEKETRTREDLKRAIAFIKQSCK